VQKHVDADARLRTGTCESKSAIPITPGPERQLPDIDSPVSHKEACDDEHANDRNCTLDQPAGPSHSPGSSASCSPVGCGQFSS
jgi:hypothetical protein